MKDEGGSPMTMINFGTFRSSLFGHTVDYIRDVHARLPDFTFRDSDVLLASYPKAGKLVYIVLIARSIDAFLR